MQLDLKTSSPQLHHSSQAQVCCLLPHSLTEEQRMGAAVSPSILHAAPDAPSCLGGKLLTNLHCCSIPSTRDSLL